MAENFPPGHFYSTIPDLEVLDRSRFTDAFPNVLSLDPESVLPFAREVFSHGRELSDRVDSGTCDFHWCNSQFPPADALAYFGMLRMLKPQRIVEIGSGFSTQVAVEAIRSNGTGRIACVEPYPRDFLKASPHIELIEKKLQETPDTIFGSLGRGDVLFVDSSHQVKCQSDVLDIFFRIMDLVGIGAWIHFHDIFIPDDYPWFWLKDSGLFFNEQYFLLAFLKDNPRYRCVLPNAYVVRKHRQTYERWLEGIHQPANECFVNLEHGFIKAGSFWIEKLA